MTQNSTPISPTLLGIEQMSGKAALNVLENHGSKCSATDLARLQGAYTSSKFKNIEGKLTTRVWSASSDGDGYVRGVHDDGVRDYCYPYERLVGARPALLPSETSKIEASNASLKHKKLKIHNQVDVVEYGEYPQEIVSKDMNDALEKAFKESALAPTGKTYTLTDTTKPVDEAFGTAPHQEYLHEGKKYIRMQARPFNNSALTLNDYRQESDKPYWLEVKPVEWLVETEGKHKGTWVTKEALFSGVPMDDTGYYGDLSNTIMGKYLVGSFAKDLKPSNIKQVEAAGPNPTKSLSPETVVPAAPTQKSLGNE